LKVKDRGNLDKDKLNKNVNEKSGFKLKPKEKKKTKIEIEDRLESQESNSSKLSAKKVVNKLMHRDLVQYTNEDRSSPENSEESYHSFESDENNENEINFDNSSVNSRSKSSERSLASNSSEDIHEDVDMKKLQNDIIKNAFKKGKSKNMILFN